MASTISGNVRGATLPQSVTNNLTTASAQPPDDCIGDADCMGVLFDGASASACENASETTATRFSRSSNVRRTSSLLPLTSTSYCPKRTRSEKGTFVDTLFRPERILATYTFRICHPNTRLNQVFSCVVSGFLLFNPASTPNSRIRNLNTLKAAFLSAFRPVVAPSRQMPSHLRSFAKPSITPAAPAIRPLTYTTAHLS